MFASSTIGWRAGSARNRTDTLDAMTWLGSGSAEAVVKIGVTFVASLVFIWRWRRWSEPALLAGVLVLEVMVFVTSSFVVDRARPPVSQLDSVPLTSSFPSGHTAAAVAFYGAIAIIVFWHTRNRIARGRGTHRRGPPPSDRRRVTHVPRDAPPERRHRGRDHRSRVARRGLCRGETALA